jgi:hypothetical protein
MVLDTIAGVLEEQCRVYRLTCNGKLKPAEMGQMLSGLKEIRSSIESLPAEADLHPDRGPYRERRIRVLYRRERRRRAQDRTAS